MAEDSKDCGSGETFAVPLHSRMVYDKVYKEKLKNVRKRIWRILR